MRVVFLVFLLIINILFTELCTAKRLYANEQRNEITDKEKDKLTRSAYDKARALGYKTEELNFDLSRDGNGYKAYFYPKQKPGMVTYGGTLTVYFDHKGNILRFDRGI